MITGINYDAGFVHAGVSTHEPFGPDLVAADMRAVHDRLGVDAVRVTGGDAERLEVAARAAATAGLAVWWCPFLCDVAPARAHAAIADAAERAERLRGEGAEVVFLAGAELSLFVPGFLPGATFLDRARALAWGPALSARFAPFLADVLAAVRERFGGRVGYCALPFETVDWAPFDLLATDAGYRAGEDEATFRAGVRALTAEGRPVAITEFGCVTYRGAAARGGHGSEVVVWDGPVATGLDGEYVRDEREQADHVVEQLDLFADEGVEAAFVYTFANFHLPRRAAPEADLDLASAGVVAVSPGRGVDGTLGWEPKAAFGALADWLAARG